MTEQQQEQDKMYLISEKLVLALLAYLEAKPYAEVAAGIQQLRSLEQQK